jgi:hypothetical protein
MHASDLSGSLGFNKSPHNLDVNGKAVLILFYRLMTSPLNCTDYLRLPPYLRMILDKKSVFSGIKTASLVNV